MSAPLEIIANICAILTACVAVWLFVHIKCAAYKRRTRVEKYLKGAQDSNSGSQKGQHSVLNIMARVGLTEQEVLQASFESKHIKRVLKPDAQGYAQSILLWYVENSNK